MTKRPTNISRKNISRKNIFDNNNNYGYVIIGDTVAATLYAKRLLVNNITQKITIIVEGKDRFNTGDITNVNFAPNNTKTILHYVRPEQIHTIPAGDDDNQNDGDIIQNEQIIHYNIGSGTNGDFISAYMIPRVGPWFTHSSNGRLENFLNESTLKYNLTKEELEIVNRLSRIWKINTTNSLIVNEPSILNVHYEFLQSLGSNQIRQIFNEEYNMVKHANNVNYVTETSGIKFSNSDIDGLYNITADNLDLPYNKLIWKNNIYSYLRIATEGGLNPKELLLPTFYRATLSIPIDGNKGISDDTRNSPQCCSQQHASNPCCFGLEGIYGIDFSNVMTTKDFVTSHITFSLHDIDNPNSSTLAWLIQAYTTPEDLSVVHPDGKYADSGHHLLIIEGLSTKNKRRHNYDKSEHEIQVRYNSRIIEEGFTKQFAHIVSSVYNAYTGKLISPEILINDSSVCSSDNRTCQDANIIIDYSLRQSPMISVVELASHLYGAEIYPNSLKF
jgi:hypothetical protein